MCIDPRDINQMTNFAEAIVKHIDLKDMTYQQLAVLKKLCCFREEEIKILFNLSTKDYHDMQDTNEAEITINESSNINAGNAQEERNAGENLINISKAQLFHLKKRFDLDLIKKIDNECSKKQIAAIVGNIIRNEDFDVWDYIPKNESHQSSTGIAPITAVLDDGNFTPVCDDFSIPF